MSFNKTANQQHSDETIDFRALIYSLWENKLSMLIIMLVVSVLAMLYTWIKVPIYEANTIIQIKNKDQGNSYGALSQQLNLSSSNSSAAAQIALIRSRFILEPVVSELGLSVIAKRHYFPLLGRLLARSDEHLTIKQLIVPTYLSTLKLRVIDATHYQLLDKNNNPILKGEIGKLITNLNKSLTIEISEMYARPGTKFNITKNTSNQIVNDLIPKLHVEELSDATNSSTGILQITLKDTNPKQLVNVLNTIAKVTQEKDGQRKTLETAATLTFLKKQLPLAKKSLEDAETNLNIYRAKSGKLDIKLEIQQLLMQLGNTEKQITQTNLYKADLLQKFTEEHPIIMGVNDKIKQLEKQKRLFEQKVRTLPASDQIAVNYMRDIRVKNQIYLTLLNKIQELQVINAGTVSDVRILAPAVLPDGPLPKQGIVVFAASLVLGFILAMLFVLTRKAFFHTIDDPQWVEQQLGLNNFAIIPYSKQQTKMRNANQLEILAEKYPRDLSIEALRSLRTSFQITLATAINNIISIMGVSQSIGKSFVSVNFAFLLADTGKRVLLIDGDIRKGHLNDYFKLPRGPGLSEVIAGTSSLGEVIHKATATLSFVPCGNYPFNPSELLSQDSFKNLMTKVSKEYDLVIIDTAPVLAVTDCVLIGVLAGINLLLLGSGTHQPNEIYLAVRQLSNAGINIAGTIFNTLKPTKSIYGGHRVNYSAYYDESSEPTSSDIVPLHHQKSNRSNTQ